jgi:hypothetical protein
MKNPPLNRHRQKLEQYDKNWEITFLLISDKKKTQPSINSKSQFEKSAQVSFFIAMPAGAVSL